MAALISFSLEGKVALVTGGAGHLGRAMSRALAEAGAHVLVNGRDSQKAEALAQELRLGGLKATALPFDVASEAERISAVGRLERLDILVNNASPIQVGNVETTDPLSFGPVTGIIVEAAFGLTKASLPLLRREGGAVINIASMYGSVSPDPRIYGSSGANNPPHYGAAKAGLIQLTRYLACHLALDRIRVNSISPGPFPPVEKLSREQPEFLKALEGKVPMQRVGAPHEIAGAVVFFASDAASYITGANLSVDGGWTAW